MNDFQVAMHDFSLFFPDEIFRFNRTNLWGKLKRRERAINAFGRERHSRLSRNFVKIAIVTAPRVNQTKDDNVMSY